VIGWLAMQARASFDRARYRRAMMRAILIAAEPDEIWGRASRTDGLRAIRALERLNGRPFDPHSTCLVSIVRGRGPRERRLRQQQRLAA
jgi:hypothetical protein